jgi:HSP20 family protein
MVRNPFLYRLGGSTGGFTEPFLSLHGEINRLFDDVYRSRLPASQNLPAAQSDPLLVPHMDVSETDKEVSIHAEMPGVKEQDIHLTLHGDVLTISAEKKIDRKDDTEHYHFVERSYGSYQRALRIPYEVNPEDVKAHFDNGVLTVTLPKPQQTQSRSRIDVRRPGAAPSQPAAVQATQPPATQGNVHGAGMAAEPATAKGTQPASAKSAKVRPAKGTEPEKAKSAKPRKTKGA